MKTRWTRYPLARNSLAQKGTLVLSELAIGWSLMLAIGWGLAACSGGDEADGPPEYNPLNPYSGNGQPGAAPAQSSNPSNGSSTTNTTNTNTSNSPPPGAQTGSTPPPNNSGAPPSNNSGATPPANPSGGTPEGNPTPAPINNNGMNNNAGGAMAPGAGGAGNMGGGNTPTPPPANPPPANPPPANPPPPATPDIACPSGATFCSGFESDTLPAGATYQSNPTLPIAFDTTVKHSGNRSLKVVSAGGFNIREVVTPIPGQAFWVRLFVQTSTLFGDNDHDSLFVASTASPSQDNNAEDGPEFSEQGNQVFLNASDSYYSAAGPGFPQGMGPQLTPNTWHCEEAFYDGATGNTKIFSDGVQIIDAVGFTPRTYQTFRLGYIGFNTVRTVWFDDVVVAADRINCP